MSDQSKPPARFPPIALGVVHGVVDATTIMVLFRSRAIFHTPHDDFFRLIIVYDLLAFATQPAIGLALDRLGRLRDGALAGLGLCLLAVLLLPLNPTLAVVVGTMGNAAYHVGAGGLTIRGAAGRSAPLGLFVAPGALGVAVGAWAGHQSGPVSAIFILCLVASAAAVWLAANTASPEPGPRTPDPGPRTPDPGSRPPPL